MNSMNVMIRERQMAFSGRFCVGLDPDRMKTPESIRGPNDGVRAAIQMMGIVDATHEYAAAFKPQRACWEALDGGIEGLRTVISNIHTLYPDIPVLLDVKRGDIDRTQAMYGLAHLVHDEADGVTLNPYMGRDCLEQLVQADPKGTAGFITLGRTSNPAAWQIQDAMLKDGRRVWEYALDCALEWALKANVVDRFGVVMGAAHAASQLQEWQGTIAEVGPGEDPIYSAHLYEARKIVCNRVLFLVPGIGKQGGFTEATLRAAWRGPGTLIINQSSGIAQASMGGGWQEAARVAARKQCDENASIIASILASST